MAGKIPVIHVESGKVFASIKEAARYYGLNEERVSGKSLPLPGYTFRKAVADTTELRIPQTCGPEEWKPIPGYEGLYSISNKGRIRSDRFNRIKKPSTNNSNQHIIVLSKNSIPHCYTAESLYFLTWMDKPISESNFCIARKYKPIRSIDDNITFNSRKACCEYYSFDYAKFMKAIKAAKTSNSDTFSFKSKNFKIL